MKNDPSAVAVMLIFFAIALHIGVTNPLTKAISGKRAELATEEENLARTSLAITQAPGVRERIDALETSNACERAKLITPLLNSFAMRAKTIISSLAVEAGFSNVEYDDGGFRALPIPKEQMPSRRTGRHAVIVRAQADYAAIASFLLRAERELPLMSVQSVTITPALDNNPEQQKAVIILEWPCEGEVIR